MIFVVELNRLVEDVCESDFPDWFREASLDKLDALEQADASCRWPGIGNMRPEQQIPADVLRRQGLLRRLAPLIRNELQDDHL